MKTKCHCPKRKHKNYAMARMKVGRENCCRCLSSRKQLPFCVMCWKLNAPMQKAVTDG